MPTLRTLLPDCAALSSAAGSRSRSLLDDTSAHTERPDFAFSFDEPHATGADRLYAITVALTAAVRLMTTDGASRLKLRTACTLALQDPCRARRR